MLNEGNNSNLAAMVMLLKIKFNLALCNTAVQDGSSYSEPLKMSIKYNL